MIGRSEQLPRLVIVEPDAAGHHLVYVSRIARGALAQGREVDLVVSSDGALNTAVHEEQVLPLVASGCGLSNVQPSARSVMRAVVHALRREAANRVVVPDGDRWMLGLALAVLLAPARGRIRVLMMRPARQDVTVGAALRFAMKRACGQLIAWRGGPGSLAILDVPGSDWLTNWPAATRQISDMNLVEPIQVERRDARAEFGILGDQVVLGLIGVLSRRKNPDIALEASRRLSDQLGEPVVLLCVGPVEDDARVLLQSDNIRVVLRPSFVSDEVLSKAITSCDAVLCLYSNEGSSGIVTAAKAHGVPVIAGGATGVQAMVSHLNAGICVELDADAIAAAVTRVLSAPPDPQEADPPSNDLLNWALDL